MKPPKLTPTCARLVIMLRKLEGRGFGAATYPFIAKTLDLHPDNAKKAALAASRTTPPVVAITTGRGRGNKSTVRLTAAGRAFAEPYVTTKPIPTPKVEAPNGPVPPQGVAGQ